MNDRDVENLRADAPADFPKYPDVTVQLTGADGNAFAIIGRVRAALREYGCSADEVAMFVKEATAGDYDHLLQTCFRWVDVA